VVCKNIAMKLTKILLETFPNFSSVHFCSCCFVSFPFAKLCVCAHQNGNCATCTKCDW